MMIKDRGELLNHMARLARRRTAGSMDLVPNALLGVAMGKDQARVALNPTPQDYTVGAIMRSADGTGANIGSAKCKLDAVASICGQSCNLNNEGRMGAMRTQLDLAKSVAVIKQAEAQVKRAKKEAAVFGLFECGPAALLKPRSKGGDVAKLPRSEICAIAHRYLATDLVGRPKVPALAAALH